MKRERCLLIPHFPDQWLDELKSRLDIVQVLSKYMYLQKKGNSYWACCPFHNEKTPSFSVNAEEQYYHCFGCGKGGSVFTFLMEHEHMTFAEAVETLAKEAHMELPEEEDPEIRKRRAHRAKILEANKVAARYFFDNTKYESAAPMKAYLKTRNIDDATQVFFGIGYSPDGRSLAAYMEQKGYAKSTLVEAGLIGESGYDPLAGRMIIPIINARGEVIGFGGRTLVKDEHPKYRNTKATVVFDKRKNLYNINRFVKAQKEEKFTSLVLTEGYMDVISLYKGGIHNVVASMGTSLTVEQCNEINRYVKMVYVCYDGDAAGQNATWRSLDMLSAVGLEVRVMSLPDGMDPDDTVNKLGVDGFKKLMDEALPLIEFKIRTLASRQNLNTPRGRESFALETIPVLVPLEAISKETYVKLVSDISGISKESIFNSINDYKAGSAIRNKTYEKALTATEAIRENINEAQLNMSRFILASALEGKAYVHLGDFGKDYFTHPVHRAICEYIEERIEKKDRMPRKGDLYDLMPDDPEEVGAVIEALADVSIDKQAEYYDACLKKVKERTRKERIASITEKLKTAEGEDKCKLEQELLSILNKR